jgi:hypothetical protein
MIKGFTKGTGSYSFKGCKWLSERGRYTLPRDWHDDMKHPKGDHESICRVCGETFKGFKRRHVCYACVNGVDE